MRPEEKALTEGLGAQYVGRVHYPTSMNTIYAFIPDGSTMADDNAEFWIVPECEEDEVENLSKREMQEFILELLSECQHDTTTRDATWFDVSSEFILAMVQNVVDMSNSVYYGTIEFESGDYFYVERQGNRLIAGSACNVGIIPEYEIEYDFDQPADVNLQNLVDVVQQEIYSKNA